MVIGQFDPLLSLVNEFDGQKNLLQRTAMSELQIVGLRISCASASAYIYIYIFQFTFRSLSDASYSDER